MPFQFRHMRGMVQRPWFAQGLQRATYEGLWRDLFFKFTQNTPIQIEWKGESAEDSRELSIFYNPQSEQPLFVGFSEKKDSAGQKLDPSFFVPITFKTVIGGRTYELPVKMDQNGQLTLDGSQPQARISIFPSTYFANPPDTAAQFSNLRVRKEEGKLVNALTTIFPNIRDIGPEIVQGTGMGEMYCEVPGMPEKVPLALVSNGINRLLSILLYIANQPKGVVLVDEIENGIHHSKLREMWEAVLKFRQEYDVQLFISTHCLECLNALKPALRGNPNDFRLLHAQTLSDGSHTVSISKGADFEAALEEGIDPR